MQTLIAHNRCVLLHGDSAELGSVLAPDSIDALITDPPAGIAFMNKSWDKDKGGRDGWVAWLAATLAPSFAALKPGAFGLVWALPRTSHWTAYALEAAGFEIRDRVSHLFGTGFPKSMDISKAIDKRLGATVSGTEWEGWGTALKPACEDWWLVQTPFRGTYAENVLAHGVGGLNIDATRLGENPGYKYNAERNGTTFHGEQGARLVQAAEKRGSDVVESTQGRWPAHVVLSHTYKCWRLGENDYLCPVCGNVKSTGSCDKCGTKRGVCAEGCAVRLLDEQSGVLQSGSRAAGVCKGIGYMSTATGDGGPAIASSCGGASRFFYVAKGSRSEKDAGLDHLPARTGGEATDRIDGQAGLDNPRAGAGRTGGARNIHPTVKSVALMRWLVRLITPPGGTALDPFAGSGTTGIAALEEGMSFVGCEREAEYLPIIEGRLRHALGILPR